MSTKVVLEFWSCLFLWVQIDLYMNNPDQIGGCMGKGTLLSGSQRSQREHPGSQSHRACHFQQSMPPRVFLYIRIHPSDKDGDSVVKMVLCHHNG